MIAFFSVHCSKKKGGGLGLGILALAGGGGSSSSSSGDSTDKPKDDPKNDPEFDEVKKKIEQSIKFPTQNENKVLKNNNDYKAVDLSITGEFFQDLKNLKDLEVEHQVSAGEKKTTATTIQIKEKFITKQKIPLVLDLSSLQPDTGFIQPKLSLKFSSEKRQIILKDWTQNFYLEGTKQQLLFHDENDNSLEEGILLDKIKTAKITAKGIPDDIQIRIEAEKIDASAIDFNVTNSWTEISIPTQGEPEQKEKTLTMDFQQSDGFKAYLLKAKASYRLNSKDSWKILGEQVYRSYSFNQSSKLQKFRIQVNKTILAEGDDLTITVKKVMEADFLAFYILKSSDIRRYQNYNIINIIAETGPIRQIKDNGGLGTAGQLIPDWRGRTYFADATRVGNKVENSYQFTFKGVKNKSLVLSSEVTPSALGSTEIPIHIKILVRP